MTSRAQFAAFALALCISACAPDDKSAATPKPTIAELSGSYEAARHREDWAAMLEIGREMDRRFQDSAESIRFNAERADIAAKAVAVSLAGIELKPEPPTSLKLADARVLRSLLSTCRTEVDAEVERANGTPFTWTRLDESAADSFRLMAPSYLFVPEETRVTALEDEIRSNEGRWASTSFPVLEVEDSFSGPQRTVKSYTCFIESDLSIRVKR